jgi:hypothetical protein
MTPGLDPETMTAQERLDEVAAILAAGFLRLKCRRGYVPEKPSEQAEPPPASEGPPEFPRN